MDVIHYLGKGDAPRLAYRHRPGRGPAVVFLPGYMSDMEGGKATALDAWAGSQGQAMLRFDYAGCGSSGGAFDEQTLQGWRGNVLAMIDEVAQGRSCWSARRWAAG